MKTGSPSQKYIEWIEDPPRRSRWRSASPILIAAAVGMAVMWLILIRRPVPQITLPTVQRFPVFSGNIGMPGPHQRPPFPEPTNPVQDLIFRSDGTLVSIDSWGILTTWSEFLKPTSAAGPTGAGRAKVSYDGRRLAMSSSKGLVINDRSSSGMKLLESFPANQDAFAFNSHGTEIAVAETDGSLSVYSTNDGRRIRRYIDFAADVDNVAWSGSNTWIAVTGRTCGTILVEGATLREKRRLDVGGSVVRFNHGESVLGVQSSRGRLATYRLHDGERLMTHDNVRAFDYTPDGGSVVTVDASGCLKIFGMSNGQIPVGSLSLHEPVSIVRYAPDGSKVALGTADGKVKLVEMVRPRR